MRAYPDIISSAMAFRAWLGLTSPISRSEPTPQDESLAQSLRQFLQEQNVIESGEEENHRYMVMMELDKLATAWIRDLGYQKGMPDNQAENAGGRVCAFGSYRLGVQSKGGDIDALLIAPKHVDRKDFFTSFVDRLRRQEKVTDLRAVDNAYVPVIKMYFDGVEIDLTFARLMMKEISAGQDLVDHDILRLMDVKCIRSLNGFRVTDEMLSLVPNRDTFREALRAIKLWAKRRGVYSNVLGFLGGVSWAILVAFICQKYPNAAAPTIIQKFFIILSKWNWPQPIFLKLPDNLPDIDVGTALWDPRTSMGDRHHLMPIITPSFPHQNSTYNVGRSSLKIMQAEFLRGEDIMNKIYNPKEGDPPTTWSKLFEHLHFFTLYNHFILVIAKARTREELKTWRGCVESRLRILVQQLENNDFVSIAHVLPRDFPIKEDAARPGQAVNAELMPVGVQWFIGLNIPKVEGKPKINLSDDVNAFLTVVRSYGSYSSIMTDGMEVSAKYCLRKGIVDNLPTETIESDPELSILLKGALMQKQKAKPVAPGAMAHPAARPALNGRPKMLRRDSSSDSLGSGIRIKRMRTSSSSSDLNSPATPATPQPGGSVPASPRPPASPSIISAVPDSVSAFKPSSPLASTATSGTATSTSENPPQSPVITTNSTESSPGRKRKSEDRDTSSPPSPLPRPIQQAIISEEPAVRREAADSTQSDSPSTTCNNTPPSASNVPVGLEDSALLDDSLLDSQGPSPKRFCVSPTDRGQVSV